MLQVAVEYVNLPDIGEDSNSVSGLAQEVVVTRGGSTHVIKVMETDEDVCVAVDDEILWSEVKQ